MRDRSVLVDGIEYVLKIKLSIEYISNNKLCI